MFGFGKKKQKQNEEMQKVIQQEDEKQYTCLFCKKKFKANEILFASTLSHPDPNYVDYAFDNAIGKYHAMTARDERGRERGLTRVYRRFLDNNQWEVLKREENGLPLMVKGPLVRTKNKEKAENDIFGFLNENDAGSSDNDEEIVITSSERLCPKCHFTLPEGFATDRVIQVGLLGGSRSGKTTYMAVVTKYLQNKMGLLNSGLELARVELLPECREYEEALYLHQRGASGAGATQQDDDIVDHMILPMIMHFMPIDPEYSAKPFFLILQDIPGEYLKPENENHLLNSNIPLSNDLIFLVDINHFVDTKQKEYEHMEFGDYCPQDLHEQFSNVDSLSSLLPEGQLRSVQCTLTKLDFWKEMEGEKERLNGAIFAERNCDDDHRGKINDERLNLVHEQISTLLRGIGDKDQSGLLDNLINSMNLQDRSVHKAYTAIASRIVPNHEDEIREHGADYQFSFNVLEPLMNVFEWENLLPVKK